MPFKMKQTTKIRYKLEKTVGVKRERCSKALFYTKIMRRLTTISRTAEDLQIDVFLQFLSEFRLFVFLNFL